MLLDFGYECNIDPTRIEAVQQLLPLIHNGHRTKIILKSGQVILLLASKRKVMSVYEEWRKQRALSTESKCASSSK